VGAGANLRCEFSHEKPGWTPPDHPERFP
jgi:hypothetical protein